MIRQQSIEGRSNHARLGARARAIVGALAVLLAASTGGAASALVPASATSSAALGAVSGLGTVALPPPDGFVPQSGVVSTTGGGAASASIAWEETEYDETLGFSVDVTVSAAAAGLDPAKYPKVGISLYSPRGFTNDFGGGHYDGATLNYPGGQYHVTSEVTRSKVLEQDDFVRVQVVAYKDYTSQGYVLLDEVVEFGYVDRHSSLTARIDSWEPEEHPDPAYIYPHYSITATWDSIVGRADNPCTGSIECLMYAYAVNDAGESFRLWFLPSHYDKKWFWTPIEREEFGRHEYTLTGNTAIPADVTGIYVVISGYSLDPRGPAEWVSDIVPVTPVPPWDPDDVRLRALEVNQAVQTWENDVPLVARKHTVVRAFLEIEDESLAEPVKGRLHGYTNGVELPGSPLAASNWGNSITPVGDATSSAVRGDLDASLYFDIPDSWTTSGGVRLWLDGGDPDEAGGTTELVCGPAAGNSDENCAVTVVFVPATVPLVAYFGLAAQPDFTTAENGCTISSTSPLHEQNHRVEGLYPVPWIGHSAEVLPVSFLTFGEDWATSDFEYRPCPPNLNKSNLYLKELRMQRGCTAESGCDTLYVMVLAGDKGGLASGIPSDVATSSMGDTEDKSSWGYARNRTPHELGHTLGLWHAVGGGPLVTSSCDGAQTMPFTPRHPYMGTISYGATTKSDAPLLGPQGEPATEVWGLDTRMSLIRNSSLAVVSPYENGALMGYCRVGAPQARWVSAYEYNLLAERIDARFGGDEVRAAGLPGATESGTYVLASGVISGFDTPEASIDFDSVSAVTGAFAQDPGSDYTIRVWDGAALVGEVPFTPDVSAQDVIDGATNEPSDEPPTATFVVPVLVNDARYTRIEVLKSGAVIGGVNASAHGPVVSQVSAAVKDVDGAASLVVDWRASDSDGDRLTAKVRFSADGGATWKVLAIQVPGTSTSIPVSQLGGAANGRVEIQVSDGMLVSNSVMSGKFVIADVAPELGPIEGLGNGAVASGGNAVWARASAEDVEDGRLEGDALVWRSNLDGVVAGGPELMVDATTLTEGLHLMSVTATDSAGNTSTATDYLYVRHASSLLQLPDVTPADLFGLLDQTLVGMDLHPGVHNPLEAAAADATKEWGRERVDKTCSALERFAKIVDLRDGDRNGLNSVDAGILRGTAALVSRAVGCAAD